jgi:50S ribosomal protein L16 3-hydroxylase
MPKLRFPEGVDAESFLHLIWQRKPLLMRGALPGLRCPIDPDELAGLACEPEVESRIVLEHGDTPWELRHGPFAPEAFASLPPTHWTLLVQDVEKHVPEVARLLDAFRFIPDWRVDDVMVSYAADQGSVGPHVDQYDVFLVQAQGRRRWQIDSRARNRGALRSDTELKVLAEFQAEREWLLEPGDVLYLPPGVAHWGIAEQPCMTCSVGYRAPALRELLSGWCEHLIERTDPERHYRDPPAAPQTFSAEITAGTLAAVDRLLAELQAADAPERHHWFGRFATEVKPHLAPAPPVETLQPAALHEALRAQGSLRRHPYSRAAFACSAPGQLLLFVNGEAYALPEPCRGFAKAVAHERELHFGYLEEWLVHPACLETLTALYNAGALVLPDD